MIVRPKLVRPSLFALSFATLLSACNMGTGGGQTTGSESTSLAPAAEATTAPQAAQAPEDCGVLIYDATVAEHQQPMRGIIITTPPTGTSSGVYFIAPDRFKWHVETPDAWEEMVSIEGAVYARSSVQDWQPADLLNPLAAAAMQQFIDPPAAGPGSAEDLLRILAAAGVADPGLEANVTGPETEEGFQPLWVCELIFKSGDTAIAHERTWIGTEDGLRHNFEHEEGGVVTEMRTFLYSDFLIEGPPS